MSDNKAPIVVETKLSSLDFSEDAVDFAKAQCTAIISDLHLCEAEPPNKKHPLWKKFKTREFFFDTVFANFLDEIRQKAEGKPLELVLNGDIFDFDSLTNVPKKPWFRVSWLERRRGLDSEVQKSVYKINVILGDHPVWVKALSDFIKEGNKVIFVVGNHDLELYWNEVQRVILDTLKLSPEEKRYVRFVEWFYISNKDTLIEHSHQYDPFCATIDPVNPVVVDYNRLLIQLPFGDLACRYLSNGVGFVNPHVESNYNMSLGQYVAVFFKYMVRAQPWILWTWFWSSITIFIQTLRHANLQELNNPLTIEDRVNEIARKANATPRMVREMRGLFARPVAESPAKILKELWLDRAFLLLLGLAGLLYLFLLVDSIYDLSFYIFFVLVAIMIPPYIMYSRTVRSYVNLYKRPSEHILTSAGMITGTKRVVYGHTHSLRHEMIGAVEHLNSGTWSPGFEDVECTESIEQRAYIWISPRGSSENRRAQIIKI